MADPFARLRNCSCLSCELIVTVLDRQREAHSTGWQVPEVLNALAEASAFFCNEIYAQARPIALNAFPNGPEGRLHDLVLDKIGVRQHEGTPAPAEKRPEGMTIH